MFDWLLFELRALATPSERARFALDLSNQRVTLIERTSRGDRLRGEAKHGAPDFDRRLAVLRRKIAWRRAAEAPVDVLLPSELTLYRVETFPPGAARDLRDEAWWRLDRLTPYRPEDVCYDVVAIGTEPKTGFVDAQIAIAPRDVVDEALGYVRGWGFSPLKVGARVDVEGFPHGPTFLDASERRRDARSLRRAGAVMAAAAVLLACVGAVRGVLERQAAAQRLEARLEAVEERLETAQAARFSALALARDAALPGVERTERRPAAAWLAALADATPQDATLARVALDGETLRIEGAAVNAEAMLAALDGSDAFADARHAGPTSTLAADPRRRGFVIEARVTPRAPAGAATEAPR